MRALPARCSPAEKLTPSPRQVRGRTRRSTDRRFPPGTSGHTLDTVTRAVPGFQRPVRRAPDEKTRLLPGFLELVAGIEPAT